MIPALIGAAGAIGGTMLTNSAQAAASKKQMEFQAYMSNTAYRRAARDLEKAGLNRILALGSPASTPAGAQPNLHDLGQSLSSGINSGLAYKSVKANVERTKAETGITKVEERLSKDMLKFYEGNPGLKKAILGGMLSRQAGLSGVPGATTGALKQIWNSAKSGWTNYRQNEWKRKIESELRELRSNPSRKTLKMEPFIDSDGKQNTRFTYE